MIKLELYRAFGAVAEAGSISAAAQRLYLSQPAVSQLVRQLEEQLGTALFTRSRRGVTLTREGETLYQYVSRALTLLDAGEEKLEQAKKLLDGELTIGASDTVTDTWLLPRLEAFHKAHPAIRLRILNGTSQMLLDLLQSGQVDLAFATQTAQTESFTVRRCLDTHALFVAAPDYPIDFDHVYTLEEVAALPLILLERKASSRLYLERCFAAAGLPLHPEIELGAHYLLLSLAQIGLGVACVTEEFSRPALERGVVRPLRLEAPIPPRAVVLCALPGSVPSLAARRFMEFLESADGQSPR